MERTKGKVEVEFLGDLPKVATSEELIANPEGPTFKSRRANAYFIKLSWNNHDRLVQELEKLVEQGAGVIDTESASILLAKIKEEAKES